MKQYFFKNKDGISALTLVVVIGAAGLIMVVSSAMIGLDQLEQDYVSSVGSKTRSSVDGCIEEGLERLRNNGAYVGGPLNIGLSNCILSVQTNAQTHILFATSTLDTFMQRAQVVVERNNNILSITQWIEY